MKIKIALALSFWLVLFAVSCKNDEINFHENYSAQLKFSKDTVFCDTVYNQMRSETYLVKVYNKENKDIKIPKISLEKGASSLYRINVDGKSGTDFQNVPLRKNDSLFIFIEIAPIAYSKETIAEDKILFQNPTGSQHVTLLSVVQDAEFYIQSSTNPNILNNNTTWTNAKAKIIYGNLTLAEGKTLNIQAGTKVYFTKNSSLTISKNAILNVSGDLNNEVIFRGERNDPRYDTIPQNWKGISLEQGSTANINYAKIFGGETGLELKTANANIKNTIFHTFQKYGIYALNSVVNLQNTVINNCGEASLGIYKGGKTDVTHCTLANYWNYNNSMPAYALYATNEFTNASGTKENASLDLNIKNSIIYGNKDNVLVFKPTSGQTFHYLIDYSLVKHSSNAGFVFDGNPFVINSIKNENPKFLSYFTEKMNMRVAEDSPAKGKGKLATAQTIPQDILKVSRTGNPTVGAYQ